MFCSQLCQFEYHISLHHSQTSHSFVHTCEHLNTIYLYIILKLMRRSQDSAFVFKCHISLYHPQTVQVGSSTSASLNTIYPYIILKPRKQLPSQLFSLNTIYLYIILKHTCTHRSQPRGLNTIYLYIILKRSNGGWADCGVLIPYIFTSFSNGWRHHGVLFAVLIPYIFTSFSNICCTK